MTAGGLRLLVESCQLGEEGVVIQGHLDLLFVAVVGQGPVGSSGWRLEFECGKGVSGPPWSRHETLRPSRETGYRLPVE